MMSLSKQTSRNGAQNRAFSLVEVLIVVVILGIVVFLAVPNVVQVRRDSEDNLARSRVEALNIAVASFYQAAGRANASATWSGAGSDEARYQLLAPYLAFPPASLAEFMPAGYSITFHPTEPLYNRPTVTKPSGAVLDF